MRILPKPTDYQYSWHLDELLKESLKGYSGVQGVEAAVNGALAGLLAQVVTTPLDVARTRIMIQSNTNTSTEYGGNPLIAVKAIAENEGLTGLTAGITPRALRAVGSGAIQFASIEGTIKAIFG